MTTGSTDASYCTRGCPLESSVAAWRPFIVFPIAAIVDRYVTARRKVVSTDASDASDAR